ncbi:MAG: type VI secretion system baseplate subunit TssG [Colwellia sp.]|nr:type VI secretion system baseplate subunit TssG [Colwellia sp.]
MSLVQNSPLLDQALSEPELFDLVPLIRILNRHFAESPKPFELVIEADPMPNNIATEISDFELIDQKAIISSSKTSLTSGYSVVPVYIYEELLTAFHNEQYALTDFLNIFNERYFKLYVRTVQKTHLILTDEIDRYFNSASFQKKYHRRQQVQLTTCLAQLTALPDEPENKNWLGYSMMLGSPNRSLDDLQQVLADYFSLKVTINSGQLNKFKLDQENWTRLGKKNSINGRLNAGCTQQNNQLGRGFLLGQCCWLSKQRINITITAKSKEQLNFLNDDTAWLRELAHMTRCYLRDKTEIAIYLKAPDSWFKRIQISVDTEKTARLGRGFHLKNSQQNKPVVYLIHLVKD